MARLQYRSKQGNSGVDFDFQAIDPAVEYLKANPEEVGEFIDATLTSIRGLLGWQALETSREAFEALCQVLEQVTPGPHGG